MSYMWTQKEEQVCDDVAVAMGYKTSFLYIGKNSS